jgi:hypothetical protein
MKRVSWPVVLALTALVVGGLTSLDTTVAQELPKDRVPFKATIKGDYHAFLVPGNPAILSIREDAKGEATLLGPFTWAAHHIDDFDLDLGEGFFAEGVGAFTAANGDAIYVKYGLVRRPSTNPNLFLFDGAWVVTGGRGRFAGASGSGFSHLEAVPTSATKSDGTFTITSEGTVSAPKP